jgi:hypothetical protein
MSKIFKKYYKDFKNSNKAVQEIIGTVLLLGMAVTIFSGIYVGVLSVPLETNEPNPIIVATIEGRNIIFEHRGGEELSLDTKIEIVTPDEKVSKTVGELLIDTNNNNHWNIGERLAYPFDFSSNPYEADVISIDVDGNKVILLGTLNLYPGCDIGVEIFRNQENTGIWNEIQISIKATHYTGKTIATDIQIEYIIPKGLNYVDFTSTQGYYNNETGIWDVGAMVLGGSATITITTIINEYMGMSNGLINTAKLLSSTPPDQNPDNDISTILIFP